MDNGRRWPRAARSRRAVRGPVGVAAAAAVSVLLLAACGGPVTTPASTPATTPAVSSTGGSAPTGSTGAATESAAGSLASTGAGISVPIQTVAGPQDQPFLTTQISVGGGAPVTVWLDTGSSGLIMDPTAVGPDVTQGTRTQIGDYETGSLVSVISTASVTIGGAATATPIAVGLRDDAQSTFQFPAGTVGIMGIGTANSETFAGQGLFAPQLQMPAPLNTGSTLRAAPVGQTGTWTLGPVDPPSGAVALPLTPITVPGSAIPPGYPSVQRGVPLCWTVGTTGPACGPTDIDAGSPSAILTGTQFSGLAASSQLIPTGTPVTVTAQNGPGVWTFTSGSTYANDTVGWVGTSLGSTDFNTGLGFLIGRTVVWDYPSGQVLVGPAG